MKKTIKKEAIMPRIEGIEKDVAKLRRLGSKSKQEFENDEDTVALAEYYLRRALEGVFHIGEHILSRLPGGRITEYKEIARRLGDQDVVDKEFANNTLLEMAGYRNRLTHFYADVDTAEIYELLQDDLGDFDTFLIYIRRLMEKPNEFGLDIE